MNVEEKVVREIISAIRNAPVVRFDAKEDVDEGVVAKQDWLLSHIDRALAAGASPDEVVIPFVDREPRPNELRIQDSETLKKVLYCYQKFQVQIDPEQVTRHEEKHSLGTGFRTAFSWVEEDRKEPRAQLTVSPDFRGEVALPDLLASIGAPQELSPVDKRMHRKIVGLLNKHGF